MITAKVQVSSKEGATEAGQVRISFAPDYADGRNKEWALNTPTLSLQMYVKSEIADQFPLHQPFTLTFTPDPAPEQ